MKLPIRSWLMSIRHEFFKRLGNPLPKEYWKEYREYYGMINLNRLPWVLGLLMIWALVMIVSDIQAVDELKDIPNFRHFLWIDSVLLCLGMLLFLISRRINRIAQTGWKNQYQQFVFLCTVIFVSIGAIISGVEYEATRGAPSYIIGVFLIVTIFDLSSFQIIVAYAISTTVLIITAGIMSHDYVPFILRNMSLFVLVLFGWFNARILSLNRKRLFLERKRLAESNTALANEVEERKEAQAALQKAHDVLEDRVIERTNDLDKKNLALEQTIQEKDVLLQEVYHRVKNNLQIIISLLNLHARSLKDVKLKEAFRDSQNRIRSMALIHEKLYQSKSYTKVDFEFYIQDLVYTLFRSFHIPEDEIEFDIRVESVVLSLRIAVPCGLVINELISNAFKYAFPESHTGKKKVSVHFQQIENEILELVIADNGVGIRNGENQNEDCSLGQELIELLAVQQLNGSVVVDGNSGTKYTIRFPVSSEFT